jgi:hypothetical protein
MPRLASPEKMQRASDLRNAAVDLVARHGAIVPVKKGGATIGVMAYQGPQIAVLYTTPRVDLNDPRAPAHVNPKAFMVDVWFENRKTLSVQWDHDGPLEILMYKPGYWEASLCDEAVHEPVGCPAAGRIGP